MDIQQLIENLKAIPIKHESKDVSIHQSLTVRALLKWIDDWEVDEIVSDIFEWVHD